MDENKKKRAELARKRRQWWSIAICLVGLSFAAINLSLALWAGYRRNAGRPLSPAAVRIVISADALMLPGLILSTVGFAGAVANSSRENSASQD